MCQEGTFNLEVNSKCKECPIGAVCSGGTSLAADIGYWQLQVGLPYTPEPSLIDYDVVTYQPKFYRCRSAPYACCPDGGCAVNESVALEQPVCADRRSGVLCSWCDEGFTLWAGECLPCEGVNGGMVFLGLLLVAAVLLFLIMRPPSKSAASVVVIDYYQLTNIISVPSTSAWWCRFFAASGPCVLLHGDRAVHAVFCVLACVLAPGQVVARPCSPT